MKKVLKFYLWIWSWKKSLQKDQFFWKDTISWFFIWEWAKQISVWNYPRDNNNLWNKFQFKTIQVTTITYETNSSLKLSKWQ
jgi:hypothetical protein